MDINELFPSKYVSAPDITKPTVVTIDRASMEEMIDRHGNPEQCPVVYFKKCKKGMVLNKTNAFAIGDLHGSDTEFWSGQKIELYTERINAFGEMKDAVRARAVSKGTTVIKPAKIDETDANEIPF